MMVFLLRALAAGLIFATVVEIARWSTRLAAVILFVPFAIPVAFAMIYLREQNALKIARMSREALALIPLSLPFFVPLLIAERLRWPFWAAFVGGLVLASGTLGLYLWLGPREA